MVKYIYIYVYIYIYIYVYIYIKAPWTGSEVVGDVPVLRGCGRRGRLKTRETETI